MKHYGKGVSKWALALLLTLPVAIPSNASGRPDTVRVGEVTSAHRDTVVASFRAVVVEEVASLELDDVGSAESFVLSASVVALDVRAGRDETVARCVVSATLRAARQGTIVAMLRGRGRVVDGPRALASAKRDALRAAVRSAVSRVPEALRRKTP